MPKSAESRCPHREIQNRRSHWPRRRTSVSEPDDRNGVKSGKARSEHIPSGLLTRADVVDAFWHFWFVPDWGHSAGYSITSSARPSSGSGTVRRSVLAVLRLMISSTFWSA